MTISALDSYSDSGLQAIQQRIAALRSFGSQLGFASALQDATSSAATSDTSAPDGTYATGNTYSDPNISSTSSSSPTSQAIASALSYLGTPYQWGGTTTAGIDCSALVQNAFRAAGIELPRVAADQAKQGTAVSAADAQPGDLVFFGSPAEHVGIYLGKGQMIDAPHTGTVVRIESVDLSTASSIRRVASSPSLSGAWVQNLPFAGKKYVAQIADAASTVGVDPALLASVAWQESGFQSTVTSPAGAQGLMQLMPATAAGLGVDPNDPAQALLGAAKYLKGQLDRFGGRIDLALAAYNAGPTAVARAGGVPDYPETQAYVKSVLSHLQTLRGTP